MNIHLLSQELEEKIKSIRYHACEYGYKTYSQTLLQEEEFNLKEFQSNCFDGFKVAQKEIISELIRIQTEKKMIKIRFELVELDFLI